MTHRGFRRGAWLPFSRLVARGITVAALAACSSGSERSARAGSAVPNEDDLPVFRTGALIVRNVVAPAPATVVTAAVYLTIENTGGAPDTLVAVTSDVADHAVVHESMDMGAGGPMTGMGGAASLGVPVGTAVRLAPGGRHIMLEGLRRRPVPGDEVALTLRFLHAGAARIRARVVAYADLERVLGAPQRQGGR